MNVAKKYDLLLENFFLYLSICLPAALPDFLEDHKSSKTAFFKICFHGNKHRASRRRKLSKVSHTSQVLKICQIALNFEKYVSVQSFALANFEDWSGAEYTVKLEKPENKTRENRARGNRKSLKWLKKVSYSKFRNLKLKSCEEYLSHRTSLD